MSNLYKKADNDINLILKFFEQLLSGFNFTITEPEVAEVKKNETEPESEFKREEKKYNNPAEAAIEYVNKYPKMPAKHCWDWVEKIYNISGFDRKIIFQAIYSGKIAGTHGAGPHLLQQIQPGDWLFLNNQNKYDEHGNHSAIFLNWESPNIAKIASYYDGSSHIHTYNINKFPVTAIMKPIPKKIASIKNKLYKKANVKFNANNPGDVSEYLIQNNIKLNASNCNEWVRKVYDLARCNYKGLYFNTNYPGKDAGNVKADQNKLSQIKKGDWIFVNNKNSYDEHGNHSGIFLEWESPDVIKIASSLNNGTIHTYNIKKYPITAIFKYVPIQSSNIAINKK